MIKRDLVIDQISEAFSANEFPGDAFIQGSHEGCEPYEVIAPFKGLDDWKVVDPVVLDANSEALSFFSEAGFRFFLPAYLIADLQDKIQRADPLFHLTHGFNDASVKLSAGGREFDKRIGKLALMNPRRYGAMTFHDHARYRLSVFTREEARAIVAFLQYKRASDPQGMDEQAIDAALEGFWLGRAATAPQQQGLAQHLQAEADYLQELEVDIEG